MIDLSKNFGYNKQYYTVPNSSMYTVEFSSIPAPNYFRVNNTGETVLYCSTQGLPTEDKYSFKVDGNSVANFTEPHPRNKLYIYNPSKENIKISITYWNGEFDPAFLGLSEITINPNMTIKTDGMINGFSVPLPSGDNKIGNVGITGSLPAGTNNIGTVKTTSESKISNISNKLDLLYNNHFTRTNSLLQSEFYDSDIDEYYYYSIADIAKMIYEKMGTGSGGSNVDIDELKSFIDFNAYKIVAEQDDILSIGDILYLMLPSIENMNTVTYQSKQYLQEISQKLDTLISNQTTKNSFIQTFTATESQNIIAVDEGYYVGKFICSNLSNTVNILTNAQIMYTVNGVNQVCRPDYWNTIADSVKLSSIEFWLTGYDLTDVTFEVGSK